MSSPFRCLYTTNAYLHQQINKQYYIILFFSKLKTFWFKKRIGPIWDPHLFLCQKKKTSQKIKIKIKTKRKETKRLWFFVYLGLPTLKKIGQVVHKVFFGGYSWWSLVVGKAKVMTSTKFVADFAGRGES